MQLEFENEQLFMFANRKVAILVFQAKKDYVENIFVLIDLFHFPHLGDSNSGSAAGGGGSGDMVIQEDTIFVSGMNPQTNEDDIANHFGAIGIIKVRIELYELFSEQL